MKKGKLKLELYNTFYSSKSYSKNNKFFKNYNNILKGTKSILKNCRSYKNYIKDYKKNTEIISFKSPKITKYPILNSRSLSLIPISKTSIYKEEEEKNNKKYNIVNKEFNTIFSYDENENNNFKFKFHNKMRVNLRLLGEKYRRYLNKKKEKENPIISEFFYKWTRNDYVDIKNLKLNNFSSLSYDEKKIFFSNYNDFLREKIQYMKSNKITNLEDYLESEFYDMKGRKIKMELISIKLAFKQIDKNNEEIGNEQVINLPLSFVFLFYINGFDFFKKIILSSIQFSNNFNIVSFNDKNIYYLIKKYFKNDKDFEEHIYDEFKKSNTKILKKESCNYSSKNYNSKIKIKRMMTITRKMNDIRKKTTKATFRNKKDEDKKIEIFHVNKELQKKESEKEILLDKDKEHLNFIKDKIYDEFEFIWETPIKTYKVLLQLPIMKLWCEHLNKTVIAFCEKNLFLYMLKNNFINWDFHALHYFFSIKKFRKMIIKKYSFKSKPLLRTLINDINTNGRNFEDNYYNDNKINKTVNKKLCLSFFQSDLYIRNKKVKNLLNENNESFIFFYTDNLSINSIIEFHSYRLFIDYNDLNPYKKWHFYLNFNQMKFLTKIRRYELLETFLPKIIKTNFEYGTLYIDFSVFNDFDSKILNYKKNKVFNNHNNLEEKINENIKKNFLKIEIKKPYILIEKFVGGLNFSNISGEIEIEQSFLNIFNKDKNNIMWTKTILKILEETNKHKDIIC